MRVYCAIDVSEEVKERLRLRQLRLKELLPDSLLSYPRIENVHLTLHFLGHVDPSRVGDVRIAVEQICQRSLALEIRLGGNGIFPRSGNPRTLWAAAEDDTTRLASLQGQIYSALLPWTEKPGDNAFVPHLTLARVKRLHPRERKALTERWLNESNDSAQSWPVQSVSLYSSMLSPGGSIYNRLAECVLCAD